MSAINLSPSSGCGLIHALEHAASTASARIAGSVRRWVVIRRNRYVLRHLDDATLNDIGLERDGIDHYLHTHVDRSGHPTGGYPLA